MELARWRDQWARTVALTADRWFGHIITGHAPLIGQQAAIALAITDPDVVSEDPQTLNRECYYRAGAIVGESPRLMVKVIVQFLTPDYGKGYVVTAHPTRRVKPTERIKWIR